jgi:hypothetical protein
MDDQQFVQLLRDLLEPDTEKIKAATATLKQTYYTSPAALNALLQLLTSQQEVKLRQLAAVEARKLVPKHWASVPADQKPTIRNSLLQSTLAEEQTLLRHSTARVITAIAKIDLEDGEWTDLPNLLQQAANSDVARHREVGVYIVFTLMEAAGELFMDNLPTLFALFHKTIEDPESAEVRANTMMALGRMAVLLDAQEDEKSLETFQATVPKMVAVLKAVIDADDEVHVMQAFEVFQLLLSCDSALLAKHFRDLLTFMMDLACQTEVDNDYRSQALAFLTQSVRLRKLRVQGLKIGAELAERALSIVPELGDAPTDEEEIVPATSALAFLDILASSLPPSQVVVPLLTKIGPYVSNQNPDYRRGGILALSMLIEGAPDFFSTQLKEILPMVLQLLQESEAKVRSAAIKCIARLADDLAEEMGKEHETLLPALIRNLDLASNGADDTWNLEIIKHTGLAIDSLLEGLVKPDAAKYVSELMPRLSRLFNHPDMKVKYGAVCAVGSLAAASGDAFQPYFQDTMQALGSYVTLTGEQDQLDLRATACDAISRIAGAAGPEQFNPFVRPLMEASEEALRLDNSHLREMSYLLWSAMAKVYGEDFAPYLQGAVRGLHDCMKQEEKSIEVALSGEARQLLGPEVVIGGKKLTVVADDEDEDDDAFEIDEDGDDDWEEIDAVTAVALEKEMAIEALGDIISHTKEKYLPFVQETVQIVSGLVQHDYEGIRKTAISTLCRTYATMWGIAEAGSMEKWKPGLPLAVQPPEDISKLGNMVMSLTLQVWTEEMDRSTVADINSNVTEVLKNCGPAFLMRTDGTVVPEMTNLLLSIMTKRHPCQQDFGDEDDPIDEESLDESSEYDWFVIQTAMDTIAAMSVALGPSFGELWKVFEKPLFRYCSSTEAAERNSSVGSLAECIGGMAESVTPYTTSIFDLLLHRLGDEDKDVRSNAAYATGLLFANSTDDTRIGERYAAVFGKLESAFDTSPTRTTSDDKASSSRLTDNAAGCVARLIMRSPGLVPLAEVLPRLVAVLPLKEDLLENAPVYKMLVQLYRNQDATVQQLTPQLMPVFETVIAPPEEQLDEETRAQVLELVEYLRKQ